MMRVFLDANILFSAAQPKSHLGEFVRQLGHHAELLTNGYAYGEAERNIQAKNPKQLPGLLDLTSSIKLVPLALFDLEIPLVEKDRPILCGAILGHADFLLTGDKKDFGRWFGETVQGVKIVTVEMLLAELIARGLVQQL